MLVPAIKGALAVQDVRPDEPLDLAAVANAWSTDDGRSMLGSSLVGKHKYTAAVSLLLKSYEGLKD
jgi:hypothetical protein